MELSTRLQERINPALVAVGLDAIPLKPNSKLPACPAWNRTPPVEQWQDSPEDANIGIIPGAGFLAVDADNSQTVQDVSRHLEGLGYPAVVCASPHGAHYWLHVYAPEGFNIGLLRSGEGEVRAHHCYLCSPNSVVDDRPYVWQRGGPENFASLPLLEWPDLAGLVSIREPMEEISAPPLPLLRRDPSGRILGLLADLRSAQEGEAITTAGRFSPKTFATRSEAEFSILCSLICSGNDFELTYLLFERNAPARYLRHGAGRREFLQTEYRRALAYLRSDTARQTIEELYQVANSLPWPGRTGLYDLAILQAVYTLAWQRGSLLLQAPVRDVSILAAAKQESVSHSLRRLTSSGWLRRSSIGTYLLMQPQVLPPKPPSAVTCAPSMTQTPKASPELWAKLGRSAGVIYGILGDDPAMVKTLAKHTGKTVRTVYRALDRLESFGLAARAGRGKWIRGSGRLEDASKALHTEEAGRIRRRVIDRQRAQFREVVIRRKIQSGCTPDGPG